MTVAEIAERIDAHLKRFEADPDINACRSYVEGKWIIDPTGQSGTRSYYHAYAGANGRWVVIKYVSYQSAFSLSKANALQYLEWLDAGNVGTHFDARRGKVVSSER